MPGWRDIIRLILSIGIPAAAAPAGTVVVAQGVDPTTRMRRRCRSTSSGISTARAVD
jgi:hypothetical protein